MRLRTAFYLKAESGPDFHCFVKNAMNVLLGCPKKLKKYVNFLENRHYRLIYLFYYCII